MRAGMGGVGIASVLVIVGILLVLAVVVGIIVLIVVLCTRNKNKSMPQATVNAFVVGRRESASGYFIAFQLDSGERMELGTDVNTYGMAIEGTRGVLTFQGTRCVRFQRV